MHKRFELSRTHSKVGFESRVWRRCPFSLFSGNVDPPKPHSHWVWVLKVPKNHSHTIWAHACQFWAQSDQRSRFYGWRSSLIGKNGHFSINVEAFQCRNSWVRLLKIPSTIAILSGYMHKKFRPNRMQIRGGCQWWVWQKLAKKIGKNQKIPFFHPREAS